MKTFSDIIQETLRYGFSDGPQVNEARIKDWINEAQRMVATNTVAKEFEAAGTIALTVGKYKYTLPTDFDMIESVFDPESTLRLRPVDLQTFDANNIEVQGIPTVYTLWAKEIWVYPLPSTAHNLELRYIKEPKTLVAGTDVPDMDPDYLHLLVDYALARAYRSEDDLEAANQHQATFDRDVGKYAAAVQHRIIDKPQQLLGTWSH